MKLNELITPCLVIHRTALQKNIDLLQTQVEKLGVTFRPHVKTCKSADIARLMVSSPSGPITVSTLKEAAYFLNEGFQDITYAVGIAPGKLAEVANLMSQGADIKVLLDEPATATLVCRYGEQNGVQFKVLLEIDCDGHRAGFLPEDRALIETAQLLTDSSGASFEGLLTHGGSSYDCRTPQDMADVAELERSAVVLAAKHLEHAGIECRTRSVGSTPTAVFAKDLTGATELRAGVYVFMDLFQTGIGVPRRENIAVAVLASVIGYIRNPNRIVLDAGALALSKDRSTQKLPEDWGFGLVRNLDEPIDQASLFVEQAFQEHGIVASKNGEIDLDQYPIGAQMLVVPNHACTTSAAHDRYYVLDENNIVQNVWQRSNGW